MALQKRMYLAVHAFLPIDMRGVTKLDKAVEYVAQLKSGLYLAHKADTASSCVFPSLNYTKSLFCIIVYPSQIGGVYFPAGMLW